MKVVIVEDEKPAARRLNRLLNKRGLDVVVMLHSVAEGVAWFSKNEHPDLIFLDIQLSDGLSFEIFETVKVKSAIIFTTAYDEYALKAFKLNSIDYLLKPIDDEELDDAIEKFEETHQSKSVQLNVDDFRNLLHLSPSSNYKSRFTIQIGQHLKIIDVDDIVCFYSENKGTFLPGYLNQPHFLGQDWSALSPGIPFAFGSQRDIRDYAGKKGWITKDSTLNTLYKTNFSRCDSTLSPDG